jgi:peptide/nickel transport system permease protein
MASLFRRVFSRAAEFAATLLLASILGATLVCLAPGTGIDDSALDVRLSESSRRAIEQSREYERSPVRFIPQYLSRAVLGDFGISQAFQRPVAELAEDRWPETARTIALGLLLAWPLGLVAASLAASGAIRGFRSAVAGAAGMLLTLPAALVALGLVAWGLPASLGIALVVFPKVYGFSEALLRDAFRRPWVTAARARGIAGIRIFPIHVLAPSLRPLAALFAATVTMALGAALPLEALGGWPGLGQLAWRATLARDVNLLVGLTLMITAITLAANLAAETLAGERREVL